jgi:hypothetical protein
MGVLFLVALCVAISDRHAYINEIHGSRSKIPGKKSRQAALRGGI